MTTELLEGRQLLSADGFVSELATHSYAMFHALSSSSVAVSQDVELTIQSTSSSNTAPAPASSPISTNDGVIQVTAGDIAADEGPAVAEADANDIVSFRLELTDTSGTPIDTVTVGDEFVLNAYVQDIRAEPQGVYSAYLDVAYDGSLASAVSAIAVSDDFRNGPSGSVVSGLFDEVGGVSPATSPTGAPERLVFEVTLQADAAGELTFTSNETEVLPMHDVTVFPTITLTSDEMDFGSASLTIQEAPAIDHVAFAKALADAGVVFYGAGWCPACTQQKEQFEDGQQYLPFVEVTNPDRTPNQIAIDNDITAYPTWTFPGNGRVESIQSLQELSDLSGVPIPTGDDPSLAPIGDQTVLDGAPLWLALDGYDPNGGVLTYEVTVDNPELVTGEIPDGNRSLRITVDGFGQMVFELFDGRAPQVTERIGGLADDGFYDGLTFHRILDDFVIQGGDPNGNGTGGSTLPDFDDQFHPDLQHTTTGFLSMAKTDDDTNNSQFFVTETPSRHLDFNHSIFGFLVEGEANRDNISNMEVNGPEGVPTEAVVMNQVETFVDTENRILMLKAVEGMTGSTNVTVTVMDEMGKVTSETFAVNVVADEVNNNPYLLEFPEGPFTADANNPIVIPLSAFDVEGDAIRFDAAVVGPPELTIEVNEDDSVTVRAPTDYVGPGEVIVGASAAGNNGNGPFDTQILPIRWNGIDLKGSSDSGVSGTDNLTNAEILDIDVGAVTVGSTVTLLVDGSEVATEVATGTTVSFSYDASAIEDVIFVTAREDNAGAIRDIGHVLTIELDRTPPSEIVSIPPDHVMVGEPYQYDIQHPQEGQPQFTYGIADSPTGVVMNEVNGELLWTSDLEHVGTQDFEIGFADPAGNVVKQSFSVETLPPPPKVEMSVVVEDLAGNPVSAVMTGTDVVVKVFVQDIREDVLSELRGIANGWSDLSYDASLVSIDPADTLMIGPNFGGPLAGGDNTVPGLIDEAGGFNLITNDAEPMLLFSQVFSTDQAGSAVFQTEYAVFVDNGGNELATHEIVMLAIDSQGSASADQVEVDYGSLALTIADGFTASDDAVTLDEDEPLTVLEVLANDFVPDGATIVSVGTPDQLGSVEIREDGLALEYTPVADFNGVEIFTYTIEDGFGATDTATVTVTVRSVNDDPSVTDDTFTYSGGISQDLAVLENDSIDPDVDEQLIITAVTQGNLGGTVAISPNLRSITYTPPVNVSGTETFEYTTTDGHGGESVGTVEVEVPVASPLAVDLEAVSDSGAADDDDVTNASTASFAITGVGVGATVSLFSGETLLASDVATDTTIMLTGDVSSLNGDVTFVATQTVGGDTSAPSPGLSITIDRQAPDQFTSDSPNLAFADLTFEYDVQNAEEGSVTYAPDSAPAELSVNPDTGVVTWLPGAADVGLVTFSVVATDVAGNEASHEIVLDVVDDQVGVTLRVVDHDGTAISEVGVGSLFSVEVFVEDVRTNVTDPEKGIRQAYLDLLFDSLFATAEGTASVSDVFSDASVETGLVESGRISVVGGVNTDQFDDGLVLLFSQQFRATDTGTLDLSVELPSEIVNDMGQFDVLLFGQEFSVPGVAVELGVTSVEVVQGLTAMEDNPTGNEDTAITIDVLDNDALAPTSGTVTIISVSDPMSGDVTIENDGTILEYIPDDDFFGMDSFTYSIEDESGASSSATVKVTVENANDPPTLEADEFQVVRGTGAVDLDVLNNDSSDPDPVEQLTIVSVSTPDKSGTVEIINGGTEIRYTPADGFLGVESFNYTAEDPGGASSMALVEVDVTIDPPEAVDLQPVFDTGLFDDDDVTRETQLEFSVTGVEDGAEVALVADGNVLATTIASGTVVNISVDASALSGIVAFAARQTVNGSTSPVTNPLDVTLDRDVPDDFTSTTPTFAVVGGMFAYDVENSEEGSDLAYGLESGPTGMTVDAASGLVEWTSGLADLGPQMFTIRATDLAGNVADHSVSLDVLGDQASFTVHFLDQIGNEITEVGLGAVFTAEVLVQDTRTQVNDAVKGAMDAFVDVVFDPAALELNAATFIGDDFQGANARPGDREPGRIDGAGGSNQGNRNSEPEVVLSQTFRAIALGSTTVGTEFAQHFDGETPTDQFAVTLFDGSGALSDLAMQYLGATLQVVQGLTANDDTVSVNPNTTSNSLDLISNDDAAPTSGQITIVSVGSTDKNGSVAVSQDGLTVEYTPEAGFAGTETFEYTIRDDSDATSNASVTVNVTPLAPTGIDLDSLSDSGSDDTDNITNASSLSLNVTGVFNGATVSLFADGNLVGTETATADSVDITVDAASLNGVVEFTAAQTLDSLTSDASIPLSVTIDRNAPDGFTSISPTQAFVGVETSYDVQHTEEGSITYGLINAPSSATISSGLGNFSWTPSLADEGSTSFQVTATDVAGNTAGQDVDLNVDVEQVAFSIRIVNGGGEEVTSISEGSEFTVEVWVEDVREGLDASGLGVMGAYFDLLFDQDLVEPADASVPVISDTFSDSSVSLGTAGVGRRDNIGGVNSDQNSDAVERVMSWSFRALGSGNVNFQTEASVTPLSVFGQTDAVPATGIEHATKSLELTQGSSDVTGWVYIDTDGNGTFGAGERALVNAEVLLDGTMADGAELHRVARTDSTGSYRFADVPAGTYTISQPANALITAGSVSSESGQVEDGEINIDTEDDTGISEENNFGKAALRPEFAMLYALAGSPEEPVELASDLDGNTQWQLVDTLWGEYAAASVTLSENASTVTFKVTRTDGEELTQVFPAADNSLIQILGEVDDQRLVRIVGSPSDFGFTSSGPLTPSAVDQAFTN